MPAPLVFQRMPEAQALLDQGLAHLFNDGAWPMLQALSRVVLWCVRYWPTPASRLRSAGGPLHGPLLTFAGWRLPAAPDRWRPRETC